MSSSKNYDSLKTMVDLDNFIDYAIIMLYVSNWDWPANNLKLWNSSSEHPKFRWLFYDCDACFYALSYDHFENSSEKDFTTLLLALLNNDQFQQKFRFRAYTLMQSTLHPNNIISEINTIEENLSPYIVDQIKRWHQPVSLNHWQDDLDEMRYFALSRPSNFLRLLDKYLNIDLLMYPNPVDDFLFLPLPVQGRKVDYEIRDIQGRVIETTNNYAQSSIDVSRLIQGSYLITVKIGDITFTNKFIKL